MLDGITNQVLIHDGANSLVYRGADERGRAVVVKLMREPYPSKRRIASSRRELRILERIDSPRVPRALGIREDGNRLALLLLDGGLNDLASAWDLTRPMPLESFFPLAVDLAEALRVVHAARVVHKDVKPSNILVDPATWRAQLIDFDISSELEEEERLALPPERLEGTLSYISPEQTGRMNRPLDLRSDFYSLGVTLYQLLAGRLPFTADDPLQLVHAHLALIPPDLRSLRPDCPPELAALVHTLLAKQAEDRYQSAWGLASDLRRLHESHQTGAPLAAPLRADDVPETFRLSRALYGREDDVKALMAAFERTADGPGELVLVAGPSGVGKSSLIHEVHRALAGRHGLFVEGKFDQLRRGVPYESLADALRDLVRQLMAESEQRLADWRDRLSAALGGGAQVVIDIIPELERILGPQPPAPELAPAEALNRLGLLFQRLLAVFARPEHPLVLFLDDLQWVDNASLRLLELLLADPTRRGLLVVGAYRDNEVGPNHPLVASLAKLEASGTGLCRLTLQPLSVPDVAALLGDSFGTRGEEGEELAALLVKKTGGNPFFLVRFLHALHDEGLLARDEAEGRWGWDAGAIRERSFTENVVELVSGRLRGLPEETQELLPLGASLGARFGLLDLAAVGQMSPVAAARALWPAVQAGMLLPQEQEHRLIPTWSDDAETPPLSFRFLHDRVQQASWGLLPVERHQATHLAVGRRLVAAGDGELRGRLFDAVGHLNAAADLIVDDAELRSVAELNLAAGTKARRSGAYGVAAELLAAGLRFAAWLELTPDLAQLLHELNLHCGASLSQLGRGDEAAICFAEALKHAPDDHARVLVHTEWCLGLLYGGDHHGVMARGLQALRELGVPIPETMEERQTAGIALMQETTGDLTPDNIAALADLPRMEDARSALIARIFACISPSAYITNAEENWFLWVSFYGLKLVREMGNADGSCHGYSLVGMTLCAMGDIERGIAFHRTAVALADRFDDLVQRLRTTTCLGFHQPWRDPARQCVEVGRLAFRYSLDGGDWFHASYAAANVLHAGLFGGMPLDELGEDAVAYLDFMLPHGLELGPFVQSVATLQARLREGIMASGAFDRAWQAEIEQIYSEAARVWPLVVATFAATLDGDSARALELSRAAWVGYVDCINFGDGGELPFLHGLAAARLAGSDPALRSDALEHQATLARWAQESPANYGAKGALLDAAILEMDGDVEGAVKGYFAAQKLARSTRMLPIEALAAEALAELQVDRGFAPYAHLHALDAAHAWQRWGAGGLAGRVQERWPEATRMLGAGSLFGATGSMGRGGTVTENQVLDLETALSAAEVLAGEVELGSLMRALLQLAASNAGADTSTLLLTAGGQPRVRARWTSDPERFELVDEAMEEADGLPRSALRTALRLGEPLVVDDAQSDARFAGDTHVLRAGTRSLLVLPLQRRGETVAVVVLENRLAGAAFTPQRVRPLTLLSAQMAIALENARLIEEIRGSLEQVSALSAAYRRFVPHQVVDLLGKDSILDVQVGDRVVHSVAVLFSDIRSFTSLSEELGAEATFDFLNGYLGRVAPIVRACGGFIDKYVGDALMALFPGGAAGAYEAAVRIQREVDAINELAELGVALEIGIGLHLGDAVLGTVGEAQRMEGTVISDAVNIGARLEGLCKEYEARIVASREFVDAVGRELPGRGLGEVALKGRREPIDVVALAVPQQG